jgi:hypothetical protein
VIVPGLGRKRPCGILGVHPALDGVTVCRNVRLAEPDRLTGSDLQLERHKVQAGHELGDRVFDLEPGVHLQEVEGSVLVEELDGPGVLVPARSTEPDGGISHCLAYLGREVRCRALLDQLLMAPLARAVPLAEPDDVAEAVAEDLHLDVAGSREIALEVDLVTSETRQRLALRAGEGVGGILWNIDDFHAATAAAVGGLYRHRPAHL